MAQYTTTPTQPPVFTPFITTPRSARTHASPRSNNFNRPPSHSAFSPRPVPSTFSPSRAPSRTPTGPAPLSPSAIRTPAGGAPPSMGIAGSQASQRTTRSRFFAINPDPPSSSSSTVVNGTGNKTNVTPMSNRTSELKREFLPDPLPAAPESKRGSAVGGGEGSVMMKSQQLLSSPAKSQLGMNVDPTAAVLGAADADAMEVVRKNEQEDMAIALEDPVGKRKAGKGFVGGFLVKLRDRIGISGGTVPRSEGVAAVQDGGLGGGTAMDGKPINEPVTVEGDKPVGGFVIDGQQVEAPKTEPMKTSDAKAQYMYEPMSSPFPEQTPFIPPSDLLSSNTSPLNGPTNAGFVPARSPSPASPSLEGTTLVGHGFQILQPQPIPPQDGVQSSTINYVDPSSLAIQASDTPPYVQATLGHTADYAKMPTNRPESPSSPLTAPPAMTRVFSWLKEFAEKVNELPWVGDERITVDYFPGGRGLVGQQQMPESIVDVLGTAVQVRAGKGRFGSLPDSHYPARRRKMMEEEERKRKDARERGQGEAEIDLTSPDFGIPTRRSRLGRLGRRKSRLSSWYNSQVHITTSSASEKGGRRELDLLEEGEEEGRRDSLRPLPMVETVMVDGRPVEVEVDDRGRRLMNPDMPLTPEPELIPVRTPTRKSRKKKRKSESVPVRERRISGPRRQRSRSGSATSREYPSGTFAYRSTTHHQAHHHQTERKGTGEDVDSNLKYGSGHGGGFYYDQSGEGGMIRGDDPEGEMDPNTAYLPTPALRAFAQASSAVPVIYDHPYGFQARGEGVGEETGYYPAPSGGGAHWEQSPSNLMGKYVYDDGGYAYPSYVVDAGDTSSRARSLKKKRRYHRRGMSSDEDEGGVRYPRGGYTPVQPTGDGLDEMTVHAHDTK